MFSLGAPDSFATAFSPSKLMMRTCLWLISIRFSSSKWVSVLLTVSSLRPKKLPSSPRVILRTNSLFENPRASNFLARFSRKEASSWVELVQPRMSRFWCAATIFLPSRRRNWRAILDLGRKKFRVHDSAKNRFHCPQGPWRCRYGIRWGSLLRRALLRSCGSRWLVRCRSRLERSF